MKIIRSYGYLLLVLLCCSIGIAYRAVFIATHYGLMNSDTAVLCLMAKHIAEGINYPLLYYGHSYIGATQAYLLAPWFKLFGATCTVYFRYLLAIGICNYLLTAMMFYRLFDRRVFLWALALLTLLPYPFLYPTAGIYQLALLLSVVFVWGVVAWLRSRAAWLFYLLGILAGFAWYEHPVCINLSIMFLVLYVVHEYWLCTQKRLVVIVERVILWLLCFAAGSGLYWIGQIHHWVYMHPMADHRPDLIAMMLHIPVVFLITLPHMLCLSQDNAVVSIAAIVIYAAMLFFFVYRLLYMIRKLRWYSVEPEFVVYVLGIVTVVVLACSPLEAVWCGRYLIALTIVVPVLGAMFICHLPGRIMKTVMLAALLVHPVYCAYREERPPEPAYDELIAFLKEHNFRYGFADFWVSTNLMFLSGESLLVAPLVAIDRYEERTYPIINAPDKFYLFDLSDSQQAEELMLFKEELAALECISYDECSFKTYQLIYNLHVTDEAGAHPVLFFAPIMEFRIMDDDAYESPHKSYSFDVSLPARFYRVTARVTVAAEVLATKADIGGSISFVDAAGTQTLSKTLIARDDFDDDGSHIYRFKTFLDGGRFVQVRVFLNTHRASVRSLLLY